MRSPVPDGSGDRFGLLLAVLVASYLLSAFLSGGWVSAIQIVMFLAVAGLAIRNGRVRRRTAHVALTVLGAGSVIAVLLAVLHGADAGAAVASLWTGLVLLFAVVLIVRRVLGHPVVTIQSIFGAISAYMIIGLMFSAFYATMNRFGGGGFFTGGQPVKLQTLQYFSFTTLTTLGYGDFTAAGNGGRAVAMLEARLGQVFLATLVARLVASFRPRPGPRRERTGDRRRSPVRRQPPGPVAATRISSRARARRGRR